MPHLHLWDVKYQAKHSKVPIELYYVLADRLWCVQGVYINYSRDDNTLLGFSQSFFFHLRKICVRMHVCVCVCVCVHVCMCVFTHLSSSLGLPNLIDLWRNGEMTDSFSSLQNQQLFVFLLSFPSILYVVVLKERENLVLLGSMFFSFFFFSLSATLSSHMNFAVWNLVCLFVSCVWD